MLRPYTNVASVELQPINTETDASYVYRPAAQRWRLPRHEVASLLGEPWLQKRLWLAAGTFILIAAGVTFAVRSTSGGLVRSSKHAAAAKYSVVRHPFPAEPFLAPASKCQLLLQPSLGPEQLPHNALNYNIYLNLANPAFFRTGDASGAVAAGFMAATNLTLHIKADTSCLALHATNLSFSAITASLVVGHWQGMQEQQQQQLAYAPVCLCGSQPGCLTPNCGQLFKAQADPSTGWLMSLGPYVAPAGSTLLLTTAYTATFGQWQGLWRSSPFPSAAEPGQHSVLLSTQFETSTARTVFPCMDEPSAKATFVVSVEGPSHMAILSNMPEASRSKASSTSDLVTFLPTPPMSTYLVSVLVGELQAVSAHTRNGQLVRVWAAPSDLGATAVPLRLAVAALDHYHNYTGVSQSRGPNTKWDLAAVPGKGGAVENWGLVLFDPERFLVTFESAWALFRCANVICHELAHQWFGNQVTAASWSDLLVNEGLASLVEYGCMAKVMPAQVGPQGGAVLMHQMSGPPAGWTPGVHEGPFSNALSYDASPLALPLLGSGVVDFNVPVYSKAAAVMAMVSQYAAATDTEAEDSTSHHRAVALGPVSGLLGSSSPSKLQELLQQHLKQHAYGSVTAQALLQQVIGVTPDEMSSNALAVVTGWQSPGSPLFTITTADKGLKVQQKRFCAWGLLQDGTLKQVLDQRSPAAGSHDQVITPPVDSSGRPEVGSALLCPASVEGVDRAVPWTPVFLATLSESSSITNTSSSSSNNSYNAAMAGSASCGQWHIVMRDETMLQLPQGGGCSSDADAATEASRSKLYVLEGAGPWGLFWSQYPDAQRAAHRAWVAGDLVPLLTALQEQQPSDDSTVFDKGGSRGLQLLLIASKLLQDQFVLGLSVFAEVPAAEAWSALQVAVNTSSRAKVLWPGPGQGMQQGSQLAQGFGAVLYSLLTPLLPLTELMLSRLVADTHCWLDKQAQLSALLQPVALAALAAFAPSALTNSSSSSSGGPSAVAFHQTPDMFLGGMSLNRLLTATALVDPIIAGHLCRQFNKAAAAAAGSASTRGSAAAATAEAVLDPSALLGLIHPDIQPAVLDIAAAQPKGCQLDWPGKRLLSVLQQWHLTSRDPGVSSLAAYALAHMPARGAAAPAGWQDILGLLLGLSLKQAGNHGQPAQMPPIPSGVPASKYAAQLSVLVSRMVARGKMLEQRNGPAPTASSGNKMQDEQQGPGPVASFVTQHWQQVAAAIGESKAWDVLREVAAIEVVTVRQWQSLAAWVAAQATGSTGPPASTAGTNYASKQQQQQRTYRQMQGVLGAAWSTVSWVSHKQHAFCGN